MTDIVKEYLIRFAFGDNWPIAAIIFILSAFILGFIYKHSLPKYFKGCLYVGIVTATAFAESYFFLWSKYSDEYKCIPLSANAFRVILAAILTISVTILFTKYRKIDHQLKLVMKNTKSGGDKISAWNELQKISVDKLTPWQKKKYDKHRLYLRVYLGNMAGAEQECEKYKDDEAFYHFMKAVILNFKGKHREELVEIKLAEDACDGDTDPFVHIQIIHNRGVALIGAGEYSLAQDCFKKSIEYGNENNVSDPELWLNTYYNYVFNQTRITPDISIQECLDMLEPVKKHIDIEDIKQYLGYSNIKVELLRQLNADRSQIDEIINQDFDYIIGRDLSNEERCAFEASTARMVCTGRLNPELVLERLTKDIDEFLQLPMPEKYRCFKEVDFMFKDLRGQITEKHQKIRETSHWYIVNQASKDIDEYRSSLPSEAVYEICYCLKEKAGLMKYRPNRYNWDEFLKTIQSAQLLYKENELLADFVICCLDIIDEATAELNVDARLRPIHIDVMQKSLRSVEDALPNLMEHPILNEIYLRLSIYCLATGDREKSKEYYRKFRKLGNFAIDHFAPWLRGKYSILSLYMFVIGYIETVDNIADRMVEEAKRDSSDRIVAGKINEEMSLVLEWFRDFHQRDGYFEAVVLGRLLGTEVIPLDIEFAPGANAQNDSFKPGDIRAAWLVMPAINTKIKCNGNVADIRKLQDGLFSDWNKQQFRYCNVNALTPEIRLAVERIIQMIKAEMPDYLVSNEELNRLAEDSWFDKGVMGDG